MVSEEQTITEPRGATCHGKRITEGTVVSKIFREDRAGEEARGQARGIADKRLLAGAGEDGIRLAVQVGWDMAKPDGEVTPAAQTP